MFLTIYFTVINGFMRIWYILSKFLETLRLLCDLHSCLQIKNGIILNLKLS